MKTGFKKNIRLKEYDYKSDGYYFVTICADCRKHYFDNPHTRKIVVAELALLTKRFSGLKIDYYVIMSNHVHIIFVLENSTAPLSRIIQAFKSITTLKAKQALRLRLGTKKAKQALPLQIKGRLWQRNYYEHVIRNEKALAKIREYVLNNPEKEILDFGKFYE